MREFSAVAPALVPFVSDDGGSDATVRTRTGGVSATMSVRRSNVGRGVRRARRRLALRCRIVLACADGRAQHRGGRATGRRSARWASGAVDSSPSRLEGLHDEPRPGAPRTIADDDVEAVIVKTLEETPTDATHWSTRSMAKATGMSQSAVSRIWRAFGLKPHLVDTFKLSPDPLFVEKVRDIVGLYINPPEAPWCCAWTRRPRSRPSIAPPRCSRCARGCPNAAPTTTCATAPPTSTPRSTWPRAR